MDSATAKRRHWPAELAFSLALGLVFLAACVGWISHEYRFVIGGSVITVADAWAQAKESNLPLRVGGFAAAVLVAHAALGFLAFGLARLTRAALGTAHGRGNHGLIAAWAVFLALLTLVANAAWFPASHFAGAAWLRTDLLGFAPVSWFCLGGGIAITLLTALAFKRKRSMRFNRRPLVLALAAVAAISAWPVLRSARSQDVTISGKPHVVIIGIDSLRNDLSEVSRGHTITPRLDAFTTGAYRFRDAISPLARTYPAWISTLTGRHPVSTNARFNLMPRALVRAGETLPDALRQYGYRSVYATDEVRFANIDKSFGFDQLITPPMGASDFLLGTIGDLPLVNLIAGTRLGAGLFPSNHANRAAYVTYRPARFLSRLERELKVEGPSFLAIHLTLAHWPYSWADRDMPTTPQEWRPAYRDSIEAVDQQFQEVLDLLGEKGVLDNAIVVVLSDHGDALGYPSDSMLRKTGSSREIWDSLWGHGTSVMSPHQYAVLLAIRAYGAASLPGDARALDWPVSLEDVRPTLQELVTGRAPANVDGLSLVPYLAGRAGVAELAGRIRFTETCFNTVKLMQGNLSVSGVTQEAAVYFEIEPQSGWVQLRQERLDEIMAKKQRAAISGDALLAQIPSWVDNSVTYVYSSRRSPAPRRLDGPPEPATDPDAARLWAALERRFPGELAPAPARP